VLCNLEFPVQFYIYRYIDDVLSINNSRFAEFLPLIYPPELEVKETTDTASSASFLDLSLEFDDVSQMKMTFQEIRIIATGPCIANRLRNVNTIAGEAGILLYIIGKFMILKDTKILSKYIPSLQRR
jgi:hypothetical protein